MAKRILLSCDTRNEIDDQFAITYAVKSPDCILHGVVSTQNNRVSGADSVAFYHKETETVLSLCESDVPRMMGEPCPLNGRIKPSEGVQFIIDQVKEFGSELTLVITGPATDVAAAWKHAPKIMSGAKVVFIGGWRNNEEMEEWDGKECNYLGDIPAFETIANSDMDVTILPARKVTSRMTYHVAQFQKQLRERNHPITNYLADLLNEARTETRVLWDIAAVALALGLGVGETRTAPAPVVKGEKPYYPDTSDKTVTVVDTIDAHTMIEDGRKWILA